MFPDDFRKRFITQKTKLGAKTENYLKIRSNYYNIGLVTVFLLISYYTLYFIFRIAECIVHTKYYILHDVLCKFAIFETDAIRKFSLIRLQKLKFSKIQRKILIYSLLLAPTFSLFQV
jgi:hypothetical protein